MNYSWKLVLWPTFHLKQRFQDIPIRNSDSRTGLTCNPIKGVPSAHFACLQRKPHTNIWSTLNGSLRISIAFIRYHFQSITHLIETPSNRDQSLGPMLVFMYQQNHHTDCEEYSINASFKWQILITRVSPLPQRDSLLHQSKQDFKKVLFCISTSDTDIAIPIIQWPLLWRI